MFHFLKRNSLTSYFKNGLLYKVKPDIGDLYENRGEYYNTRFVVLNGEKYDLENEKDIRSLPIPVFDIFCGTDLGVTGNLVYILRMKASHLYEDGEIELALILLRKATDMMPHSKVMWSKKDYLRLSNWLFKIGRITEGQEEAQRIECLYSRITQNNKRIVENKMNKLADDLGTDLFEASYFFNCCDECTKYRGRWYSRSGKDKRFPRKPSIWNCTCPGLSYHPVIYGISKPMVNSFLNREVDIIKYSNRPFMIERTEQEIQMKQKEIQHKKEEERLHLEYKHYLDRLNEFESKHREEYNLLTKLIPDDAPKSLGGYTKMKLSNSKNFQKLTAKAKGIGLQIEISEDYREEIKNCRAKRKEYEQKQLDLYFKQI